MRTTLLLLLSILILMPGCVRIPGEDVQRMELMTNETIQQKIDRLRSRLEKMADEEGEWMFRQRVILIIRSVPINLERNRGMELLDPEDIDQVG